MLRFYPPVVLLLVLFLSTSCFAAGFGIYEWGARGNALGGAVVGRADDPSTVASNPAGITQLKGLRSLGGATVVYPVLDVQAGGKWYTSDEDSFWMPPHVFTTYKANKHYSLGIGLYSRYGLGAVMDEDWAGRYNSYEAIIQSVSLVPTAAVQFSEKLSIGLGLELLHFNFSKKQKINFSRLGLNDGDLHISTDGVGYGFNVGLLYKPCPYARIGLVYKAPVYLRLRGDADFSRPEHAPFPSPLFRDTDAHGSVTLPDSVALGIAIYPLERLSIELGAMYTFWSKYDALTINYQDAVWPTATPHRTSQKKNWDDVWRFNAGVEYAATDWLDLRAGYTFDQSPVQDETIDYLLPTNDRHLLSTGFGLHGEHWSLDTSYTYLIIKDRDITGSAGSGVLDGKVRNADAHMFGISVGYAF